jgi:hypothetical protein
MVNAMSIPMVDGVIVSMALRCVALWFVDCDLWFVSIMSVLTFERSDLKNSEGSGLKQSFAHCTF